ncbi:MAG: YHYH protein [Myxococcales bacterium]|nr:YHYH protein [Myxococcales bacterium]
MTNETNGWCLGVWLAVTALGCGGSSTTPDPNPSTEATDITNATFDGQDPSCAAYVGSYTATAADIAAGKTFTASVEISEASGVCTLASNGIPNHDFDDLGAFATPASEVMESFTVAASPTAAATTTALTLQYDNGVFLNGVKLDVLAAACYGVGNEPLGQEKIGCMTEGTPWRYDPMSPNNSFGTDAHNAHTQPDGAYHYHGDPLAMYDASGAEASGVIGFAADGYPIHGPFIDDGGTVRRVTSGYVLKTGARVSQAGEGAFPGGNYDGTYVDDYEFTGAGDLDACNGMERNGSYGYYVTDSYPWVVGCFHGTPNDSFRKGP